MLTSLASRKYLLTYELPLPLYCLFTNTTTVEGWERDKVTPLIKRGKIREVRTTVSLLLAR